MKDAVASLKETGAAGSPACPSTLTRSRSPLLAPPATALEPVAPAELSALVHAGENASDACERVLAQVARVENALDLAIGDGLAALTVGDRLISLGYAGLRDYAREVLDVGERCAEELARLSRELRTRPLLRAVVRAGEVRIRAAQTVLPVARGDDEAAWVERARRETVRALEAAVREALGGLAEEEEEDWVRFQTRLADADRAAVDEALAIAGRLLPGSGRPERLEAMAQEYLAEHPVEAGDDGGGPVGGAFRPAARRPDLEARLERETERWSFLALPADVPVPEEGFDDLRSAAEIDARLRELAAIRARWDALLGYCAYAVRRSGLWKLAGFASFSHYCRERLSLSARTVEQRAALERRLWEVPALRAARDSGVSYERLRVLARLPAHEVEAWIPRARGLTCVALRAEVEAHEEAQLRAARVLRARVPARVAELLRAAFRAVRAVEGKLLDDGRCLVLVARHFADTWRAHVKRPRTRSQKIRERDLGRCRAPGCSRRAGHAHHVIPRSRGGCDAPWNLVAVCPCHHHRGIHGGYMRVSGRAPDALVWELVGAGEATCSAGAVP